MIINQVHKFYECMKGGEKLTRNAIKSIVGILAILMIIPIISMASSAAVSCTYYVPIVVETPVISNNADTEPAMEDDNVPINIVPDESVANTGVITPDCSPDGSVCDPIPTDVVPDGETVAIPDEYVPVESTPDEPAPVGWDK